MLDHVSLASGEAAALLQEIAAKTPFDSKAFIFVWGSLLPGRHLSGQELCWVLHDRAMVQFGVDAKAKLESWGVRATSDFGKIVYALIESGYIQKLEEDSLVDFQSVYEFDSAFLKLHNPSRFNRKMQWRLSTLLAITTVASIAFAGVAKAGFHGAIGTLFSTWMILIGAVTLCLGVSERTKDWLLAVLVGMLFIGVGIIGFVLYTH